MLGIMLITLFDCPFNPPQKPLCILYWFLERKKKIETNLGSLMNSINLHIEVRCINDKAGMPGFKSQIHYISLDIF